MTPRYPCHNSCHNTPSDDRALQAFTGVGMYVGFNAALGSAVQKDVLRDGSNQKQQGCRIAQHLHSHHGTCTRHSYEWSKMGITSVSQTITASFLPALSQVQDDPGRFSRVSSKHHVAPPCHGYDRDGSNQKQQGCRIAQHLHSQVGMYVGFNAALGSAVQKDVLKFIFKKQ